MQRSHSDYNLDPPTARQAPTRGDRASDAPSMRIPTVGELVDGKYRIIDRVGEGGMGVVLRARDERLERTVALKLIRPEGMMDKRARDDFLFEGRALARVNHENVVQIFDFGALSGSPFLVMELIEGESLQTRMLARPNMSMDEAIGLLDQICRGVMAIHASGSVHRDLKPSNILIDRSFRVAVGDFGLAQLVDWRPVAVCDRVGSMGYMAPEQFLDEPIESAALPLLDIYALGVIAHLLFTGQHPWLNRGEADPVEAQRTATLQPVSAIRTELPSAFDRIILSALAHNPAERTQTVAEFRRHLLDARQSIRSGHHRLCKLLIVDDDPDYQRWLEYQLAAGMPGATITRVAHGEEAMEEISRNHFDLVISDLQMPKMDGVRLTQEIRERDELASLPVLILTGVGGPGHWQHLANHGANGFLVKPVDPHALRAVVRSMLDYASSSRAA